MMQILMDDPIMVSFGSGEFEIANKCCFTPLELFCLSIPWLILLTIAVHGYACRCVLSRPVIT